MSPELPDFHYLRKGEGGAPGKEAPEGGRAGRVGKEEGKGGGGTGVPWKRALKTKKKQNLNKNH